MAIPNRMIQQKALPFTCIQRSDIDGRVDMDCNIMAAVPILDGTSLLTEKDERHDDPIQQQEEKIPTR